MKWTRCLSSVLLGEERRESGDVQLASRSSTKSILHPNILPEARGLSVRPSFGHGSNLTRVNGYQPTILSTISHNELSPSTLLSNLGINVLECVLNR